MNGNDFYNNQKFPRHETPKSITCYAGRPDRSVANVVIRNFIIKHLPKLPSSVSGAVNVIGNFDDSDLKKEPKFDEPAFDDNVSVNDEPKLIFLPRTFADIVFIIVLIPILLCAVFAVYQIFAVYGKKTKYVKVASFVQTEDESDQL